MLASLVLMAVTQSSDWMMERDNRSKVTVTPTSVQLSNGIVDCTIWTKGFVAVTSLRQARTGHEFIRSTEPLAIIGIKDKEHWLGGTTTPPDKAFLLPKWLETLKPNENSLTLDSVRQAPITVDISHKATAGQEWPPKGKSVVFSFKGDGFLAEVIYDIYDNSPIIAKRVKLINTSSASFRLTKLVSERLAMVEGESLVDSPPAWRMPNVTVLTSMSFGGLNSRSVFWKQDPNFTTQVNYELKTPCILEVHPPVGPGYDMQPGQPLESIKSFLVLHDSDERERKSLQVRQAYRTLAPWTLDNPLMLHVRSNDDATIKLAIDQASECGFEMVIISFGSGLNMEDTSEGNIAKYRALAEYASSKKIRLGGYSLLASRRIDDANDVINPATGRTGGAIFGNSPCLGSQWGLDYFARIKKFIAETGFKVLEHDGNYPGDVCASTTHPGHRDLDDSQWKQHELITSLYAWCRENGVFLNVPDTYWLNGSNKSGMGYRETNWSLPRELQHIHARQHIFDGTYEKTPSMGWMFVPLVEYHGGGPEATIEPLAKNLVDYELHFANTLGYGAQACWRGVRLYDTAETKAMVVRMVNWFKKHRTILESDIIHLRRPNGRGLDYVLHVNPMNEEKAMLVVYNPTESELRETIKVPLSYAGLSDTARVSVAGGPFREVKLNEDSHSLVVTVKPRGWTYVVFR